MLPISIHSADTQHIEQMSSILHDRPGGSESYVEAGNRHSRPHLPERKRIRFCAIAEVHVSEAADRRIAREIDAIVNDWACEPTPTVPLPAE